MNEKFSGFNTSVEDFFQQYEDIAALNNWSDATKFIVMPMYLSGPACYFYKTKKTSSTTYKDMKFFFEIEFGKQKDQPVQTGPPLSEETAESEKTEQPLVESELENEVNPDDEASISTTELKTDLTPVECVLEHNENPQDEAPASTSSVYASSTESNSHIEEEETNLLKKNGEINPQDENSMKNEEERTRLEKTSLSSVTDDSGHKSDKDVEKTEKIKQIFTSKSSSEFSDYVVKNNTNNSKAKIPQQTWKLKSCKSEEMKKVPMLQETPQPSEQKNRRESSWEALRKNQKLHPVRDSRYDNSEKKLQRNIQTRKIETSPKESDDSQTQVKASITAEKKQTKSWELLVKNGLPYDRGKWR